MTAVLAGTATVVLAFANHEKVLFRHEPVYPDDWRFASDPGFLLRMTGGRDLLVGLGVAVAVGASALVVTGAGPSAWPGRRGSSRPGCPRSTGWRCGCWVAWSAFWCW